VADIDHTCEERDMRRIQVQHRTTPRRGDPDRTLPLDPRDPAVLRAKQAKRDALAGKSAR
jgi:hypothetical protein